MFLLGDLKGVGMRLLREPQIAFASLGVGQNNARERLASTRRAQTMKMSVQRYPTEHFAIALCGSHLTQAAFGVLCFLRRQPARSDPSAQRLECNSNPVELIDLARFQVPNYRPLVPLDVNQPFLLQHF